MKLDALKTHRALLVAAFAFALWVESFSGFGGRDQLHQYDLLSLCALSGNEAILYVASALVQVFIVGGLGVWLAQRWGARADGVVRDLSRHPRAVFGALALVGAIASYGIAVAILREHTLTEDEKTYLFQARLLLMGRLSIDVPAAAGPLWQPYLVAMGTHWSGQYFWAQPALLALGLLIHAVHVVPAIEVACTAYFTGLLVLELSRDARAAILAAALVAVSPVVVLTGATLHNASLSAACVAISLWSLAKLHRGPSRAATWALALSTSVALHNRLLDQAAILGAAACVLAVANAGALRAIALRLLPAVALTLPVLALHPVLNHAVTGDWLHSGYWVINHGWTTIGFGKGPGDFPQDASTASSKTIANAVRMAFYAAGGPLAFVPLAWWALAGPPARLLKGGAWIALVYYGAYLVYAAASTQTTGPVYFDALVPVLAAMIAVSTVSAHDAIARRESLRRLVPALVVAQVVASLLVFWPPALLEVARAAQWSGACDEVAEAIDPGERALVFVADPGPVFHSLTDWPPMASPKLDDRILFPKTGGLAQDRAFAAQLGAGRRSYLAHCLAEPVPRIERYDLGSGSASPLAP